MAMLRLVICIISFLTVVYILFTQDFTDLSWTANKANYIALLSACCIIVAMFLSTQYELKAVRQMKEGRTNL